MNSHYSQEELDNHSNQLNPNNDAYWNSRGYDGRPDDWEDENFDNQGDYSDDYYDNCDYEDWCSDDFD